MTGDWRGVLLNSRRLWLAAAVVLIVPLVANFNERLSLSRRLFEEEARLQQQIDMEQARLEFLRQYQALVGSNAYVEWWARVQARMAKPGEVTVVPQSPVDRLAGAPGALAAAAAADTASEWWAVFFAGSP